MHSQHCIRSDGDWFCAPGCRHGYDQEVSELRAEVSRLREALQAIADSPHQSYDQPSGMGAAVYSESQYQIGVADGHRCAANTARAALEKGGSSDG